MRPTPVLIEITPADCVLPHYVSGRVRVRILTNTGHPADTRRPIFEFVVSNRSELVEAIDMRWRVYPAVKVLIPGIVESSD